MEMIINFLQTYADRIILMTVYSVMVDVVFGTLRAVKERKFNSTIGIDGLIRKGGMIITLVLMLPVDLALHLNLIAFIPEAARTWLGIQSVGITDFFAIMFACYEVVSILKNMTLCGLPVKAIWVKVHDFLDDYTTELPGAD